MSELATVRVRVVVRGRVQGVFFRATVADHAERHGVTGWISNRPDGAVEAELQGPKSKVDALVEVCREGPPRARVEDVTVEAIDPVADARSFTVR